MKKLQEKNRECVCRFCNYEWTSYVKQPKVCTRCKRYDWEKALTKKKKLSTVS